MEFIVLLVDAEGPLTGSPRDHLRQNETWDLSAAPDDALHLMVQTMEAWIVADTDALAAFYGQAFAPAKLPRAQNLETVPKADIIKALRDASARSFKGPYHKIRHAAALLGKIAPAEAQRRCPSCAKLFDYLQSAIGRP